MPSAVFRRVDCPCRRTVMLTLGGADPIECACGLDYDPHTGKALPVLEASRSRQIKRKQAIIEPGLALPSRSENCANHESRHFSQQRDVGLGDQPCES